MPNSKSKAKKSKAHDFISDMSDVKGAVEKGTGLKGAVAGKVGSSSGPAFGHGFHLGSLHHAGLAAGGGAGGGFFAGKAGGFKLGLGLGGFGGPLLLAAIVGAGSYAVYKILNKPQK